MINHKNHIHIKADFLINAMLMDIVDRYPVVYINEQLIDREIL